MGFSVVGLSFAGMLSGISGASDSEHADKANKVTINTDSFFIIKICLVNDYRTYEFYVIFVLFSDAKLGQRIGVR